MTASDVLVAAPWVIFGVVLAVICIRQAGARRAGSNRGSLAVLPLSRSDHTAPGHGRTR